MDTDLAAFSVRVIAVVLVVILPAGIIGLALGELLARVVRFVASGACLRCGERHDDSYRYWLR